MRPWRWLRYRWLRWRMTPAERQFEDDFFATLREVYRNTGYRKR